MSLLGKSRHLSTPGSNGNVDHTTNKNEKAHLLSLEPEKHREALLCSLSSASPGDMQGLWESGPTAQSTHPSPPHCRSVGSPALLPHTSIYLALPLRHEDANNGGFDVRPIWVHSQTCHSPAVDTWQNTCPSVLILSICGMGVIFSHSTSQKVFYGYN